MVPAPQRTTCPSSSSRLRLDQVTVTKLLLLMATEPNACPLTLTLAGRSGMCGRAVMVPVTTGASASASTPSEVRDSSLYSGASPTARTSWSSLIRAPLLTNHNGVPEGQARGTVSSTPRARVQSRPS